MGSWRRPPRWHFRWLPSRAQVEQTGLVLILGGLLALVAYLLAFSCAA